MASAFSINKFVSTISSKGLLDPTRYRVAINSPLGTLGEDNALYCSETSLPGRGIATQERYDHGPIRKVPYSEIYEDHNFTFYASRLQEEKVFFEKWMDKISGGNKFFFPFYNDIVGMITIVVFDREGEKTATYNFYEAFPTAIGPIGIGYGVQDSLATMEVTFTYHHYEIVI